jgi:hypothetical protein
VNIYYASELALQLASHDFSGWGDGIIVVIQNFYIYIWFDFPEYIDLEVRRNKLDLKSLLTQYIYRRKLDVINIDRLTI